MLFACRHTVDMHLCVPMYTKKCVREVIKTTVCLLTWGLPREHGRLSHAWRPLWEAWGAYSRLAGHHALLLEPRLPLLLQLLLDLVDLLCQQVVVLRLEGDPAGGGENVIRIYLNRA